MNDDELMMLVREQRRAVPMTTPVEEILDRGDMLRRRPRFRAPRAAGRAPRPRWVLTWQGPVAAVAVVLLVAASLVALKSLRNEHAGTPAASASPIAGRSLTPGAVPRYYVTENWVNDAKSKTGSELAWVATDSRTGKPIGYVPLPNPQSLIGFPVAGAADDRTFVVAGAVTRQAVVKRAGHPTGLGLPVLESLNWYLLRVSPGSADPARLTALPIPHTAAYGEITGMALSGDGSELAVAFGG